MIPGAVVLRSKNAVAAVTKHSPRKAFGAPVEYGKWKVGQLSIN